MRNSGHPPFAARAHEGVIADDRLRRPQDALRNTRPSRPCRPCRAAKPCNRLILIVFVPSPGCRCESCLPLPSPVRIMPSHAGLHQKPERASWHPGGRRCKWSRGSTRAARRRREPRLPRPCLLHGEHLGPIRRCVLRCARFAQDGRQDPARLHAHVLCREFDGLFRRCDVAVGRSESARGRHKPPLNDNPPETSGLS